MSRKKDFINLSALVGTKVVRGTEIVVGDFVPPNTHGIITAVDLDRDRIWIKWDTKSSAHRWAAVWLNIHPQSISAQALMVNEQLATTSEWESEIEFN